MHKIDTETATAENEFTDGDESQAIPATDLDAAWFNVVQRELCNAIVGLGSSLNPANDHQLLDALQEFGFTCATRYSGNVSANFPGSRVIFHTAASFTISDTMRTGAFILIIPTWGDSSPDYIDVTYNSLTHRIYKWQAMFGVVTNNSEGSAIYGWPVIIPKIDGSLVVARGEFTKFIDKNFVEFQYNAETPEGELPQKFTWQLKQYWEIGQVKRVRCTDVASSYVTVEVRKNANGDQRYVNFYDGSYREFMCIGQCTIGEDVFAVLLVNGQ
jgi:hypothetical protein